MHCLFPSQSTTVCQSFHFIVQTYSSFFPLVFTHAHYLLLIHWTPFSQYFLTPIINFLTVYCNSWHRHEISSEEWGEINGHQLKLGLKNDSDGWCEKKKSCKGVKEISLSRHTAIETSTRGWLTGMCRRTVVLLSLQACVSAFRYCLITMFLY